MAKRLFPVFDAGMLECAVAPYFGGSKGTVTHHLGPVKTSKGVDSTRAPVWGVGVSGGSDSVALLLGLLRAGLGGDVIVLHMNHGWGAADAAAAARVEELCDELDVSLVVGEGRGVPDGGSLEAAARDERFAFYKQQAEALGLSGVMLGHHGDDVVEHVLLRLGRGSGLQGLVGLAGESVVDGVTYVRPLLPFTKQALRDFVQAEGIEWQDDARPEAPALRDRLRAVVPELVAAGWDVEAVLGSVDALRDAEAVVRAAVETVLAGLREVDGAWVLEQAVLAGCLREVGARVVGEMVARAGGSRVSIRRGKRVALWERMVAEPKGVGELGGVRFAWDGVRVRVR